ncbi:hypothetical protein N9W17_04215, partial [Jannaschia sp.]|nr:hypothetical protein [Jannaschia sp.]
MTPEEICATLDEGACLDRLTTLVRHKSYTETEGERALAAKVADICTGLGLDASLQPVEGERVNAIATLKGQGGGS